MPRVDKLPFPQRLQAGFVHSDPNVVAAHTLCRTAQDAIDPIQDFSPPRAHNEPEKLKLIHIRILGHLLSQSRLFSDLAISAISGDILRGQGAEEVDATKLDLLGEFYKNTFIRPSRRYQGWASSTAPHAFDSEPPARLAEEELSRMIFVTPRNCDESRTQAMIREDYRCIATRMLDKAYARTLRMAGPVHESVEPLECCYIFLDSNNRDINGCENKDRWTLLKKLGYDHIIDHFAAPESIHCLDNVMMVTSRVRDDFDTLDLWFEPIEGVPNRYRMCSIWDLPYGLPDGHEVTFESADPRLALPNRDYLAIHAACCRVSHLSGASALFAELEQDMEANPDPTVEEAHFARALNARLENLHFITDKAH